MDAFSSADLVTWTKHDGILDRADVKWAKRAMWAPSVVEKDGWYYLFFGANDIQNDQQLGGIGVARSRQPNGPFKDYLGKPLIDRFHNGAQPIDQFVFKDATARTTSSTAAGGTATSRSSTTTSPASCRLPTARSFKEITPQGYVEGAFMLLKDGKYYFMWSEGGWTGPNYAVAYAIGTSPFGPFERVGRILQQDPAVATGAGHHSVLQAPRSGQLVHRLSPPAARRDRPQSPRRVHRRAALRRKGIHSSGGDYDDRRRRRSGAVNEDGRRVRYHSQFGQDQFVREKLLPGPTGYFIEIGADDGVDKSNTMAFEEAGWTGLCIEPSPERFKALQANRRCECLNLAISSTEGHEQFLDILGYGKGLSGIVRHYDPRHVARIANETVDNPLTRGRCEVTVPTRRLDALLAERGVTHVDFCSIDVEGSELEVLESIDFRRGARSTSSPSKTCTATSGSARGCKRMVSRCTRRSART